MGTSEMGDHWDWPKMGGSMKRGTNEKGDQLVQIMLWGTYQLGNQWEGDPWDGGPMRWGTNEMGGQWDGGPFGLAENAWTNEKGDQWEGGPMSSNNVVGDLWIGGPMRRGPMRWGTNEMGDQWVGGTNEMGDQWNGWCLGANWGTNEMGNQWDGGPMRWGTNEMGDQWDGGPMMCTLLHMLSLIRKKAVKLNQKLISTDHLHTNTALNTTDVLTLKHQMPLPWHHLKGMMSQISGDKILFTNVLS